jgi:hypothetical protein
LTIVKETTSWAEEVQTSAFKLGIAQHTNLW